MSKFLLIIIKMFKKKRIRRNHYNWKIIYDLSGVKFDIFKKIWTVEYHGIYDRQINKRKKREENKHKDSKRFSWRRLSILWMFLSFLWLAFISRWLLSICCLTTCVYLFIFLFKSTCIAWIHMSDKRKLVWQKIHTRKFHMLSSPTQSQQKAYRHWLLV